MITVTILTKDSERWIKQVLGALQEFDEVLIYDTGSTDKTLDMVKQFSNVTIYEAPFEGFGLCHNKATALARNDWILSLDSDEVLTLELKREIQTLSLNPKTVYSFPRKNFYNGKWIRWCGWHPDRVVRFYNRQQTSFSNDEVHEKVVTDGLNVVPLKSPAKHYPYNATEDFLNKMQKYSSLFAKQYAGKKKSSFTKALLRGVYTFFKNYIIKRGFLGGKEGFTISLYNANTAFYKYIKLLEANRELAAKSADGPKKTKVSQSHLYESTDIPQPQAKSRV